MSSFSTRMVAGCAAVLLCQLGILALLYQEPVRGAAMRTETFKVRMLTDPELESKVLALHEDPSMLAVPSKAGMSGKAWLRSRPFGHDLKDYTEGPRWLSLSQAVRGPSDPPPPATALGPSSIGQSTPIQTPPAVQAASLRRQADPSIEFTGALRKRSLLSKPQVGTLTVTNLISASTIHLAVEPSGRVQSARVSGNAAALAAEQSRADQKALAAARGLVFEPVVDGGSQALQFGTLIVRWTFQAPAPAP